MQGCSQKKTRLIDIAVVHGLEEGACGFCTPAADHCSYDLLTRLWDFLVSSKH